MNDNQLQRNLKEPEEDLIKFLGNQGTTQPEFTVAKIALEHRMQKKLIRPTWILAVATILTLIATLCITFYQKQTVDDQIQSLRGEIQQLKSHIEE